jgi:hypothetical protein
MPGTSEQPTREVFEQLMAELRALRSGAGEPDLKNWKARADAAFADAFGPRHRLTLALHDLTFAHDAGQGRARALALLSSAGSLADQMAKSRNAPARPAAIPTTAPEPVASDWPDWTNAPDPLEVAAVQPEVDAAAGPEADAADRPEADEVTGAFQEDAVSQAPVPGENGPKRGAVFWRIRRKRDVLEESTAALEEPVAALEEPVAVFEEPAAPPEEPAAVLDQPPAVYEQPAAALEEPAAIPEPPTAIPEPPAPTLEQPAATLEETVEPTAMFEAPDGESTEPSTDAVVVAGPEVLGSRRRALLGRVMRKRSLAAETAEAPEATGTAYEEQPEGVGEWPDELTTLPVEVPPEAELPEPEPAILLPDAELPGPEPAVEPAAAPHVPAGGGPSGRRTRKKSRGPERTERILKRVTIVVGILLFLGLVAGVPAWLWGFGGWSEMFDTGRTPARSTVTSQPGSNATGSGHSEPIVDITGDPRTTFILAAVKVGIFQLKANDAGEVYFLPSKVVWRGEFLVWLDRVRPIPEASVEVPDTFYYDLEGALREKAIGAYQRRIVLEWPAADKRIAFDAAAPILPRDAEAWVARMILGLVSPAALQEALGMTESEALGLRERISSLQRPELTAIVQGFEVLPAIGWAGESSITRSEAAELLIRLRTTLKEYASP